MSEQTGTGNFRSPRPSAPLRVRMDSRFGVLEALRGPGYPLAYVQYDTVPRELRIGTIEIGWGVTGRRLFSDRLLVSKGERAVGRAAVLLTTIIDDINPEGPFELRLPSALDGWKAYALPDVGKLAMVELHKDLVEGYMRSVEQIHPNKLAGLYAGERGLLRYLPDAVNLPR